MASELHQIVITRLPDGELKIIGMNSTDGVVQEHQIPTNFDLGELLNSMVELLVTP